MSRHAIERNKWIVYRKTVKHNAIDVTPANVPDVDAIKGLAVNSALYYADKCCAEAIEDIYLLVGTPCDIHKNNMKDKGIFCGTGVSRKPSQLAFAFSKRKKFV